MRHKVEKFLQGRGICQYLTHAGIHLRPNRFTLGFLHGSVIFLRILLFCPIRDKMDPDHIEIAILQDDASKANRIIDKLQLAVVDTGTAELIDTVQQERGESAPESERVQTEDGAVDFEVGADEEQFNMVFPQGSENASPSEPFSDSSKSFANSPSPRADQLRAKGERPSVRMELSDITAYLRRKVEPPKDRMPKMPVKIKRKEKTL